MAELTLDALAADLRIQARAAVLEEAREAWAALEKYLIEKRICDRAHLPVAQQLTITLLTVRMRTSLGIHGPLRASVGALPPRKKEG